MNNKPIGLFNRIAPIYGIFYHWQKSHYLAILSQVQHQLDLRPFHQVLDVGCGTGALCSVLHEMGFDVTGIDPASKMLQIATQQPENGSITFVETNAVTGLPFPNQAFDFSIASYVAHGLPPDERQTMYAEMSRVSRHLVIIHDYNQTRSLGTDLVEWFERGDYFTFIKEPLADMAACQLEGVACFKEVRRIDVGPKAAWYIGVRPSLL